MWNLLIRVSAVLLIEAAVSACSSVPDWVDPATWMGGSSNEASTTPQTQADSGEALAEDKTVAEASDQYPALADTPDKAPATSSSDEQKQVANALVADRAQTQYSAEALKAASAESPPPPPPGPAEEPANSGSQSSATGASSEQADGSEGSGSPGDSSSPDESASQPPSPGADETLNGRAPMPGTLPLIRQASSATPSAQATALEPPHTSAAPSTPVPTARAPVGATMPPPPASATPPKNFSSTVDANLGFQPSHAPPLDPSVSRYVSGAVINRYQRTASLAGSAGLAPSSAIHSAASTSSYAATPAAVVLFANNGTALDAAGRGQVQAAAAAFRTHGSKGYIRVVAHASDNGAIGAFDRSQARADAVAQELIKQGIPASKVLVEAVGDSRGASQGEAAEIFLQS